MEQEKSLVKAGSKLPGFVENAYKSIEEMEKFASLLLKSKLCPNHFYEKGPDNRVDFNKGKTEAVIMVLLHGWQLDLPPMTALQQVVPVNGLMSVKGDGAKSLIFTSGKLKHGSWKEERTGSIENEDMVVSITAARSDTGETLTRSFSVPQAKKAGLWITPQMLSGTDGWKWKQSAWAKYPDRMLYYRALGFLARDLFTDVLNGSYTLEEAQDMPADQTIVIETTSGAEIKIPDKDFNKERSQHLTSRAIDKIDKKNGVTDIQPEPVTQQQKFYTLEEMATMPTEVLLTICESNPLTKKALDVVPGKNTNRKLREIIDYAQKGKLERFLQEHEHQDQTAPAEPEGQNQESDDIPLESQPQPEGEDEYPGIDNSDLQPTDSFEEAPQETEMEEAQETEPEAQEFEFSVPELPESGIRDFKDLSELYGSLQELTPPVTDKRFTALSKLNEVFDRFESKEDFCRKGTPEEFNILLNLNAVTE